MTDEALFSRFSSHGAESMSDSDQEKVVATLKVYLKLCAKPNHRTVVKLPDYLDDLEVLDPKSCIVPNDYVTGRKDGGGWFSTISSFVKSSLW
ncbi:hypothetical protein ANCCAN_22389 [Ancylostoma caninum]|uniref:Uncharacterized protein n=1 Tax=Ancylostoma caninum TaxID=29170 RepID=A0A368FI48_ANCCA|nr:hypothetical protein ANCCAN_22389 [Ancylostoma caninum]